MRPVGGCGGARGGWRRRRGADDGLPPSRGDVVRIGTTFPVPLAADMRTGSLAARWFPPAERLRWCTARQLVEEGKLMLNCEEKVERLELLDALADAGRLAKGLDQLLESLAHADQLDPLDVEGILALRSISQRCAGRIEDAARILEAQNEILYAEERANFRPRENQEMRTRTKETI